MFGSVRRVSGSTAKRVLPFLFWLTVLVVVFWVSAFAEKLDLNSASFEELVRVPGIGEKLAERIIRYREEKGPFVSLEELLNIKGIGRKRLEKLKAYLEVRKDLKKVPSRKVFYQWVDEEGVVHITQFPESIPPKYRSRATVVVP